MASTRCTREIAVGGCAEVVVGKASIQVFDAVAATDQICYWRTIDQVALFDLPLVGAVGCWVSTCLLAAPCRRIEVGRIVDVSDGITAAAHWRAGAVYPSITEKHIAGAKVEIAHVRAASLGAFTVDPRGYSAIHLGFAVVAVCYSIAAADWSVYKWTRGVQINQRRVYTLL